MFGNRLAGFKLNCSTKKAAFKVNVGIKTAVVQGLTQHNHIRQASSSSIDRSRGTYPTEGILNLGYRNFTR
jgi:hypothetical protein